MTPPAVLCRLEPEVAPQSERPPDSADVAVARDRVDLWLWDVARYTRKKDYAHALEAVREAIEGLTVLERRLQKFT